jgi:cytochrome bd-type quinol oxidase subunit 1
MSSHVTVDRWQFTLTMMVNYVFPIITMGLSLFIVWLESVALFRGERRRLIACDTVFWLCSAALAVLFGRPHESTRPASHS